MPRRRGESFREYNDRMTTTVNKQLGPKYAVNNAQSQAELRLKLDKINHEHAARKAKAALKSAVKSAAKKKPSKPVKKKEKSDWVSRLKAKVKAYSGRKSVRSKAVEKQTGLSEKELKRLR